MKNEPIRINTKEGRFAERLMFKLPVILLILGFFTCYSFTLAQEIQPIRKITGKVVTSDENEPIPGANVIIKGTQTGTVTDVDGNFVIEASNTDILQVSFVGYLKEEVMVGTSGRIDIKLVMDIARLDEVVVIGYGTMKRSDLSSAQVSVGAEEIQKARATSLDQVLQGRAAGVYVTQNSGQPGAGVSVNIRGINSISSSTEPMYVIDGVQIMGSTEVNTNPLAGINPDDIESMQILQGPTATAIYGSRAANGVVVISTKRGKTGETKISYNGTYSVQMQPKLLPVMNLREYAAYQNDYRRLTNQSPIPEYADPSVLGEGTNWQAELFQKAPMQKHQLSLSGGNEVSTFYLSTEYFTQDGVAIGSGFDRYSIRLNLDNQTRKWLKIGTSLNVSQTENTLTINSDDLINYTIQQSPAIAVKNPDGSWGGPNEQQFMVTNPVALATINSDIQKRTFGFGNIYAEINIIKGLKFRTELNGNLEFRKEMRYEPSYVFNGYEKVTNSSRRRSNNNSGWNFLKLLQYNKIIGKHDLGLMLSHEAQETRWESLSGTRQGFISNNIQELDAGDVESSIANSGKGSWAMESVFGRLNYMYNEKYILQATLRADASPNFGINYRWGYFPAVSAAWRISKESFMQNIDQVNNLKLRMEYGITGNQNSGGPTYYSELKAITTPWGTGFLAANYENPNFRWEETQSYNVGLDLNMYRNRIEFIFDAYLKQTDNLMLRIPLPGYLGTTGEGNITAPWTNIGAMENRGLGITVNSVNLERPFIWKSGLTFTMERNKLTKLYNQSDRLDRQVSQSGFIARSVIGEPVWQFYLYSWDGVFVDLDDVNNHAYQNPNFTIDERTGTWVGDIKFKDLNIDNYIDEADRSFVGNPYPKFQVGLTNSFSYKNFEFYIALYGVYGNDIFNWPYYKNGKVYGGGPGYGWGLLKNVENYARIALDTEGNPYVENPGTDVPRITNTDDPNSNYTRISDLFVEDGSYLRVKNVQLSYSLPQKYYSKLAFNKVTLSAGVQNLFTFTNYSGYDPEVGNIVVDGNPIPGYDNGRYPSTRIYTLNLVVEF